MENSKESKKTDSQEEECKHENLDYYNHGYHAICKDCNHQVY